MMVENSKKGNLRCDKGVSLQIGQKHCLLVDLIRGINYSSIKLKYDVSTNYGFFHEIRLSAECNYDVSIDISAFEYILNSKLQYIDYGLSHNCVVLSTSTLNVTAIPRIFNPKTQLNQKFKLLALIKRVTIRQRLTVRHKKYNFYYLII